MANLGLLLGLARAFLNLELWVVQSEGLLSEKEQQALLGIPTKKSEYLESCRTSHNIVTVRKILSWDVRKSQKDFRLLAIMIKIVIDNQ